MGVCMKRGFTLVEVMIVIMIIGILLGIGVPGFVKARTEARQKVVIANLDRIEAAMKQCVMEHGEAPPNCTVCSSDHIAYNYLNGYPQGPTNDNEYEFDCGYGPLYNGRSKAEWAADPTGL